MHVERYFMQIALSILCFMLSESKQREVSLNYSVSTVSFGKACAHSINVRCLPGWLWRNYAKEGNCDVCQRVTQALRPITPSMEFPSLVESSLQTRLENLYRLCVSLAWYWKMWMCLRVGDHKERLISVVREFFDDPEHSRAELRPHRRNLKSRNPILRAVSISFSNNCWQFS